MKITRLIFPLTIFGVAAIVMSHPTFTKEFKNSYVLKKGGKLQKANCGLCHVGMTKKLNPYGIDLQSAMKRENAVRLSGSVLKKVEGIDSDKDGVPNRKEIDSDTLPGDPKSK